jgi:hypothetical protein
LKNISWAQALPVIIITIICAAIIIVTSLFTSCAVEVERTRHAPIHVFE